MITSDSLPAEKIVKQCWPKAEFHWYQFPCNFPIANVMRKLATSYGLAANNSATSRGSYGETGPVEFDC